MSAAMSVGGVLLLFTWLYIGGVVIILGAVINYVLMEQNNELSNDNSETTANSILVSGDSS